MLHGDLKESEKEIQEDNRYFDRSLNDINYHVHDVPKTAQRGRRDARSPLIYWMLQTCLWKGSLVTESILLLFIHQPLSKHA